MRIFTTAFLLVISAGAMATLPPPSPEAKAKAEEAAARAAWSNQVAAFKLCEVQDRVAAEYYAQARAAGKATRPPLETPDCRDPGPFSNTSTEDKPLETSGAHSPSGLATSPPSTDDPEAASQEPTRTPGTGDKADDAPAPARQ